MGWREWIALPDLGIDRIKAKVDTGARSSALHAFDIVEERAVGRRLVHFCVHPEQRSDEFQVEVTAELLEYREVRNSGGGRERRPVVITHVRLGEHLWPVELTLTDRSLMGFRFLLGRQALRRRFVIDPSRSYLLSHRHKKTAR
jgi:hypothetical protein